MIRPGYHIDKHKLLVERLNTILDEAVKEYDLDGDVGDDFTQYVKDWATRREEATWQG